MTTQAPSPRSLELEVHDPSGSTRHIVLPRALGPESSWRVGRALECEVSLRDATLPTEWARLSQSGGNYWLTVIAPDAPAFELCGLPVRSAQVGPGLELKCGESTLCLREAAQAMALPEFPHNRRPWLTRSDAGRETLWLAKRAARTPLAIYLAGETGTGKEVLAELIHAWSERAGGPFVPINCGALPGGLAESELFGHVKGAFTGAHQARSGAFLQAHGGTLFLDEIGDLASDVQVKLLRFLENGEVRPVGADRASHVDVRILCATHKPLLELVNEGRFRRDLYFRLASITIQITRLEDRPDDVELLATRFAQELGKTLAPSAMLRLKAHTWPGNVRELRHAIERASGMSGAFESVLTQDAFEFLLGTESAGENPDLSYGSCALTLAEMERVALLRALKLAQGHRGEAARILGVARSTLFEMLKRHRIEGPRRRLTLPAERRVATRTTELAS